MYTVPPRTETEVAFPLPLYGYPWADLIQDRHIREFSLEVDGLTCKYETEIKALVEQEDVTAVLKELNINIENFGYFSNYEANNNYEIEKLPSEAREKLLSNGIINKDNHPEWKISVIYYWKQKFPANTTVKIKHSYHAIPGFSYGYDIKDFLDSKPDLCPESRLIETLEKIQDSRGKDKAGFKAAVIEDNVHYILTTANGWKTPIENFKLLVEHPRDEFVSFCWNGPVKKISETKFEAVIKDFIPERDLVLYFLKIH